jgi:hypothetical protein
MRKIFMSLPVIFLLTASLVSCSDKNLGGPKSKSELLTRSPWYLEKYEQKTDNNPWVNNYASIPNCVKDNFSHFQIINTLVIDEGQMKCGPSDPQTTTSPWTFADGNTKIIITLNTGELSYTIEQLDELMLSYSTSTVNGGSTYYTRYTFHR